MEFLNEIIKKHEKPIPKKTDDGDQKQVDWIDFNFPEFYPLIHYNPAEIKDKEKQDFVSVCLLVADDGPDNDDRLLRSFLRYSDNGIPERLEQMDWPRRSFDSSADGLADSPLCFLQRVLRDCNGERVLCVL